MGGPWTGRAGIALAGGLAWLLLGVLHQGAERYVAIDNVCAWPNLTLMPDGSVVATIFNRPYHGGLGHRRRGLLVQPWTAAFWEKRGSAGRSRGTKQPDERGGRIGPRRIPGGAGLGMGRPFDFRDEILPTLVARSSDGGRSWSRSSAVQLPEEVDFLIPFGDIVQGRRQTAGGQLLP